MSQPQQASTIDLQVHAHITDLLTDLEGRRAYAEYLARLDLNGYTREPLMAEFVTAELGRLAPHLEPCEAAAWLEELVAAIGDRDHRPDSCALGEDHNRVVQQACARVDQALHALTGSARMTTDASSPDLLPPVIEAPEGGHLNG